MGRSEYDKDGFVYYEVNKKPQGNITFFIYTHTHTHYTFYKYSYLTTQKRFY